GNKLGILAEEMLADVRAGFDGIFHVLPIDNLAHALHQQPALVGGQERIPVASPNDFYDVPAGAAESRLQLLDDLAVATHRPVQTLQVAVDDEDKIVESFAGSQRQGAQRLGFIGFPVAEKTPDALLRSVLQAAVLEI